jgi:serine/threonine protein kinase
MVTSDGHIKLIDFGIAKNLKALGSNDKLMTAAGKFIGKAEYASPELVLGDVRSQNNTTDIYALGILFYRLLVGRLPFNGSQYEVLQNQLKSKVPVGNIENKALANVIKKATEKIQNNRYGSIAEFRVAIDAAEKFKPGFWDKYGKYLIICFVALTIGAGVWYWTKPRPTPIDKFEYALNLLDSQIADSVKLGFDEMKILADNGNDKAKIEIGITSFANEKNTIISQRRALLNKGNTRLSSELDATIKYLSSINDESVITPEVYYILGGAYFYQGDRVNALKNFEKALALLNLNNDASHGYSNSKLKKNLEDNISVLKNNE